MLKEPVSGGFRSGTSKISQRSSEGIFIALCFLALFSGCSIIGGGDSKPHGSVLIDSVRKITPPDRQTVPVTVRIGDLRKAQSSPEPDRLRILKIVLSASQSGEDPMPQYRLFDVRPGSVSQLLGIQNADVLVAANGYIVFHPDQFRSYIRSLPIEGAFIEIRRDAKPLLLKYTFVGEDPLKKNASVGPSPVPSPAGKVMLPLSLEDEVEQQQLPVLNEKLSDAKPAAAQVTPVPSPKPTSKAAVKKPTPKPSASKSKAAPKKQPVKTRDSKKKLAR